MRSRFSRIKEILIVIRRNIILCIVDSKIANSLASTLYQSITGSGGLVARMRQIFLISIMMQAFYECKVYDCMQIFVYFSDLYLYAHNISVVVRSNNLSADCKDCLITYTCPFATLPASL